LENAPKELNFKAYTMMVKEEEALNQWLNKQLKVELIVESSLRYGYVALCFYIPRENESL